MYNLMSLKLRGRNIPSLIHVPDPRMFQCDAVDTSPYLGGKMS